MVTSNQNESSLQEDLSMRLQDLSNGNAANPDSLMMMNKFLADLIWIVPFIRSLNNINHKVLTFCYYFESQQ
jgi:hypothetical protein